MCDSDSTHINDCVIYNSFVKLVYYTTCEMSNSSKLAQSVEYTNIKNRMRIYHIHWHMCMRTN